MRIWLQNSSTFKGFSCHPRVQMPFLFQDGAEEGEGPRPSAKSAKYGGGKQKKKWTKGKRKEKVNNAALFDQATCDKMRDLCFLRDRGLIDLWREGP